VVQLAQEFEETSGNSGSYQEQEELSMSGWNKGIVITGNGGAEWVTAERQLGSLFTIQVSMANKGATKLSQHDLVQMVGSVLATGSYPATIHRGMQEFLPHLTLLCKLQQAPNSFVLRPLLEAWRGVGFDGMGS
jgi:hypothetical protein